MVEATIRRFKRDKRGISNVVVIMLSLVLIVMIVGNVILWSYDMNQLDWEKMQEKITLTNAQHGTTSPWFVSQTEYTTEIGDRSGGSFVQTQTKDDRCETFTESQTFSIPRLSLSNEFRMNVIKYPPDAIMTLCINIRYNVTSGNEKWFLTAFNWTSLSYRDIGFNTTAGNQPSPNEWNEYAVNITDSWMSYLGNNGTMRIRFSDEGASIDESTVEIDFFGVNVLASGLQAEVRNSSPLTAHVIAIWVANETSHQRLETNLYVNSGEEISCIIVAEGLPQGNLSFRAVTERGNVAVFP